MKAGVKVVACENTMQAQKLTKADMNARIGVGSIQRVNWLKCTAGTQ